MTENRLRLGDMLVQVGAITDDQLHQALSKQKEGGSKKTLGQILLKLNFISDIDLAKTLSQQLQIPYASFDSGDLTPKQSAEDLASRIPEEFSRKNMVLPLRCEAGSLSVAMSDPLDVVLLDNVRMVSSCNNIQRYIATDNDIQLAINSFYGEMSSLGQGRPEKYDASLESPEVSRDELDLDESSESMTAGPIVKMTDLLLRQAVKARASDIHFEPFQDTIVIRYRIDGKLQHTPPPARDMSLPIISRIKVLAKMDIAEKRLPQDGAFSARIEGGMIDFRVSSIPTIHGEKIVMRILDRDNVDISLDSIGFEPELLEKFSKAIHRPHGLILMTGPTGSGKTTTLYATLNELRTPEKNIVTIEDPVEYQIEGINQVEAKPEIGLTFSTGLRSFLRQDPDIILVGEVRDNETAQICLRAALTGHMVFSTLHTNDAPSAVNRLLEIGVEPFFISSSLVMVVAQRLVRKLCAHCKVSTTIDIATLPRFFANFTGVICSPKGCTKCRNTGYLGRLALHEILFMTPELEKLISKEASSSQIREIAIKNGMISLEESGYRKVMSGLTSLEEITALET